MNCGHDSNIQRELVIKTAKQYKHAFFNTSIPNLGFPGPVVLTANPKEEEDEDVLLPSYISCSTLAFSNLMFVRLRVSSSNLHLIADAVQSWTDYGIPVVLTFMAYYDEEPPEAPPEFSGKAYSWQKRHINSYYCATPEFMEYVTKRMKEVGGRLVTKCGTVDSRYCRDCRNCETYYWQTKKHLQEKE
jgi:hypothetical protein